MRAAVTLATALTALSVVALVRTRVPGKPAAVTRDQRAVDGSGDLAAASYPATKT